MKHIDHETMEQIVVDTMNGAKQRHTSPEAVEFRKALEKDIAMAESKGWKIEIPFEIMNSNYPLPEEGKPKKNQLNNIISTLKQHGGPGSGHHGHRGRPGKVGGSLPRSSGKAAGFVSGNKGITGDYSKWDFKGYKQRGAEMVPMDFLGEALEYNRLERPLTSNIDELAEDIAKNGLNDSFILDYSAVNRRVFVGEGNHRYWALKKLGFSHAPARVVTTKRYPNEKGPKVSGIEPDWSGYVPSTPDPSAIGIPGVISIDEFLELLND